MLLAMHCGTVREKEESVEKQPHDALLVSMLPVFYCNFAMAQ